MKKPYSKKEEHVIFQNSMFDFDIFNATSAHECTGLIPWEPDSENQLDAYDEIWNYSPETVNIYNYNK